MRNSNYNPAEKDVQNTWYEEARKEEKAYSLLRNGLVRFEETERLLDASDLAAILPFRERLVLSSRERWLLIRSQKQHQLEKARRQKKTGEALLLASLIAMLFFQPWSMISPEYTEDDATALPEMIQPLRTSTHAEWSSPVEQQPPVETALAGSPVPSGEPTEPVKKEPEPDKSNVDPRSKFSKIIPVRTQAGEVWRVRKAGKWGLASPRGDILLPLKFRRVRVLNEQQGYFILEDDSLRGVASATGRIILPPVYERLDDYYESSELLVVRRQRQSGVFNLRKKQMLIDPSFQAINYFSEGLFGVQSAEGKWGFMDTKGKIVVPVAYDAIVEPFRDGQALVSLDDANFYVNREGVVMASHR